MIFFGKREVKVIELVKKHVQAVDEVIKSSMEYLNLVMEEKEEQARELANRIRELESEADKWRRETESEMYSGAFLPNFRGDILGVIESVDDIANTAESIVDMVDLQGMKIPEFLKDKFREQFKKSYETFESLRKALEIFFENFQESQKYIMETEKMEHEEDSIEREIIRSIFSSEKLDLAEKLQLKELVRKIGDLADKSEDVSDRLEISILKRKV